MFVMGTFTGQIVEIPDSVSIYFSKELTYIPKLPRSGCRKCCGRGFDGTSVETGKKIVCTCILGPDEPSLTRKARRLLEAQKNATA